MHFSLLSTSYERWAFFIHHLSKKPSSTPLSFIHLVSHISTLILTYVARYTHIHGTRNFRKFKIHESNWCVVYRYCHILFNVWLSSFRWWLWCRNYSNYLGSWITIPFSWYFHTNMLTFSLSFFIFIIIYVVRFSNMNRVGWMWFLSTKFYYFLFNKWFEETNDN